MRIPRTVVRFALVAIVGAVAACATVTEEDRAQVAEVPDPTIPKETADTVTSVPSDEPAQIVLYRTWNGEGLLFLGSGPKVEVDGREVGRCLLGDGREIEVAAGEHVISAPHSEVSARPFRINPGQTIYVECKYTVGVLVPNVQFEFSAAR